MLQDKTLFSKASVQTTSKYEQEEGVFMSKLSTRPRARPFKYFFSRSTLISILHNKSSYWKGLECLMQKPHIATMETPQIMRHSHALAQCIKSVPCKTRSFELEENQLRSYIIYTKKVPKSWRHILITSLIFGFCLFWPHLRPTRRVWLAAVWASLFSRWMTLLVTDILFESATVGLSS